MFPGLLPLRFSGPLPVYKWGIFLGGGGPGLEQLGQGLFWSGSSTSPEDPTPESRFSPRLISGRVDSRGLSQPVLSGQAPGLFPGILTNHVPVSPVEVDSAGRPASAVGMRSRGWPAACGDLL